MKEYIEREALNKVIDYEIEVCNSGIAKGALEMLKVRLEPAADVVEVVRCKDCEYYAAMITDTVSGNMETAPWGTCTQPWFNSDEYDVHENGYCSYGKRKMDKEE